MLAGAKQRRSKFSKRLSKPADQPAIDKKIFELVLADFLR